MFVVKAVNDCVREYSYIRRVLINTIVQADKRGFRYNSGIQADILTLSLCLYIE